MIWLASYLAVTWVRGYKLEWTWTSAFNNRQSLHLAIDHHLCEGQVMRLIGASLSKVHVMTTAHVRGIIVAMCIIALCLSHPGSREPCTPEMTCVFQYYWCGPCARLSSVKTPEQQGSELLAVCCEDCQQRQVGKCAGTWCKWIEPTESVKPCWPGNLPPHLCEWPMSWLYCFVTFTSTQAQHWTYSYSACMLVVEPYNADTSLALLAHIVFKSQ